MLEMIKRVKIITTKGKCTGIRYCCKEGCRNIMVSQIIEMWEVGPDCLR